MTIITHVHKEISTKLRQPKQIILVKLQQLYSLMPTTDKSVMRGSLSDFMQLPLQSHKAFYKRKQKQQNEKKPYHPKKKKEKKRGMTAFDQWLLKKNGIDCR